MLGLPFIETLSGGFPARCPGDDRQIRTRPTNTMDSAGRDLSLTPFIDTYLKKNINSVELKLQLKNTFFKTWLLTFNHSDFLIQG